MKFFVNRTSTSLVEPEEDIDPFDTDPWAQHLNLQWEKHFEQTTFLQKINNPN